MKKLTLIILLVIAITNANHVFAAKPKAEKASIQITAMQTSQKKVSIRVINPAGNQNAILKIKDEKGRQLHAETIHHRALFIRAYDFSEIPGEKYIVEVRTKAGTSSQTFNVEDKPAQATYFKPVVKSEPGLIKVVFKNPLSAPIFLNLHDQDGEIVYHTKVPSQEVFSAGLNVSHFANQPYSLRLWSSNYSYAKSIDPQ